MSARNMIRNLRDSGALERPARSAGFFGTAALFVVALVVGAGVVIGAGTVLPLLSTSMAPRPMEVAFAKPSGSTPLKALAQGQPGPFGEADAAACRRYAAVQEQKAEAALKNSGNMFAIDVSDGAISYMAAEITCIAQTRPTRLCDPAERGKLVAHTLPYLEQVTATLSMFGVSMNSPGFKIAGDDHPSTRLNRSFLAAGSDIIEREHIQVLTTIRNLARQGLISAGDFGGGLFGPPAAILPAFDDLGAVRSVCAGA